MSHERAAFGLERAPEPAAVGMRRVGALGMKPRVADRRVAAAVAIAVAVGLAALALEVAYRFGAEGTTLSLNDLLWTFVPVPFAALGALIISRQPANRIGWILVAIGAAMTLSNSGDAVFFFVDDAPTTISVPLYIVLWYNNVSWVTFFFLMFMVLYVFPTGNLLSRRWLWAPRLAVALFAFIAVASLVAEEIGPSAETWTIENPMGFVATETLEVFLVVFIAGVFALLVGGVVAIVVRYRRAPDVEREQLKWAIFGFVLFASTWVLSFFLESWGAGGVVGLLLVLGVSIIPTVITIAVLRFHLYDIDVVISKTLTFGVLAGFITGVYALVVVGVGSLVGGGGDEPNLALSIVAVAIVAVVFEPLRRRVQHWANVLVYGKRATPYEVLSSATARLAEARDPDEALAQVTELVADGTGASEVSFWVVVGGWLHPRAASPAAVLDGLAPVAVGDGMGELPGDRVVPIQHGGQLLGALSITKGKGDAVTDADGRLLDDVAAGAGVLVRNLRLNAELAERADELRRSRRRLVAAHDAERHRLERDLHDGAQQQVVAVKVKLGIARTLAEREGADQVAVMVASLADTTQEAVDGMRAVAHGIYPPLLEAEGLEVALLAARRTVPIPVEVVVSGVGRCERAVEEGVYFAVLDAVGRGVDVGASRAVVSLTGTDDTVGFTIDVDAPVGDLTAVVDRVDALDGTLAITSEPGRSVIDGHLPIAASAMEPA